MQQISQVRAVIFDMDGVLTDSEPLINEAAVRMFRENELKVQPADFHPFIGTGEDRYIGGVAEQYGFPIDLALAKKRTCEIYLELVPTRLEAFPGAVNFVRTCRAAGLKIALASSADRIKIEANLRQIGLPPEEWDAIVCAEDVTHKKPAPDIFLAAAQKLKMSPSECVVIEDAVNGVLAAKAAGMRCVAVAQSFAVEKLQMADLVKARIGDVLVADLIGGLRECNPPLHPSQEGNLLPQDVGRLPSRGGAGGGSANALNETIGQSKLLSNTDSAPPVLRPLSSGFANEIFGQQEAKPWGFWASVGLSLAIGIAIVLAQAAVTFAWIFVAGLFDRKLEFRGIETNGLFLAFATCATTPVAIGLAWAFASLRRSLPVKEYLGLKAVTRRELFHWAIRLGVFMVFSDGLTSLLGRPIVPEFMTEAYRTAGFQPLLWLAVIVAAPLGEEVLFRGFLFQGLAHSKVGGWGAVVFTSIIWAVIHLQYDLYGVGTIFVAGLVLGYARLKTGSIYTTIAMHSLMNLIATIQVAVLDQFAGTSR